MGKYVDSEKLIAEIKRRIENWTIRGEHSPAGQGRDTCESRVTELSDLLSFATSLEQEQPEVDLEKFTEKMDAWKARYNYPDNISIKATMAFTARMFYMYPNAAREWYDSLPKTTQD